MAFEKNLFTGTKNFKHSNAEKIGVLLSNLGTPDAPTKKALKPYLAEFLWDPRVVEVARPFWWMILNLIILNKRPAKTAKLYKKIWTKDGSPLLAYSKSQKEKIQKALDADFPDKFVVELGMRYGNPSIKLALDNLKAQGATKIISLPFYPHYSGATIGTAFDAVADVLKTWRWVPELRTINGYHDHPLFIKALVKSIDEDWQKFGKPEKLILSYHGIPKRYFLEGDPYHCTCHKTSRLIAESLGLKKEQYLTTFQSLFGSEEWIRPYTDETLISLAKSGTKSIHVICPGFSSDCLETIEEIEELNRENFLHNGGEQYHYIKALNDKDEHIEMFLELIKTHTQGWSIPSENELTQREKLANSLK